MPNRSFRFPTPKAFGDRRRVKILIWLAKRFIPRAHLSLIQSAVGHWGTRPDLREQDRVPMREIYYVAARAQLP